MITLIKDHIVNTHLINGLNALGGYSLDYHLHLSDVIFKLMGIADEKEGLFEMYLKWCSKISRTDIFENPGLLDEYATEMYAVLQAEME